MQPMPWPMIVGLLAFCLYGLWPALYPEHFRSVNLRYTPRWAESYVLPEGAIRAFAILWFILAGLGFMAGVYSRL